MKNSIIQRRPLSSLGASIVAAIAVTASPMSAQASEDAVLVPVPQAAYAEPADARFEDAVVRVNVVREGKQLGVALRQANGASTQVKLDTVIRRVVAIHRHESRLVIVGKVADGGASEVCIVDWASGRIVDRFRAHDPSVSPDASMIAFVRFYPVHFTAGAESQYRLYRVGDTARANRSYYRDQYEDGNPVQADAGEPIFVAAKGRVPRDNFDVEESDIHQHFSRLTWSEDSRRVGVIDAHGQHVRALVMPVSPTSTGESIAHLVDGFDKVCLPARPVDGCSSLPFGSASLSFDTAGGSLRVKIDDKTLYPKGFARTLALQEFARLE